jgi:uracil phosphoribosyltransferase
MKENLMYKYRPFTSFFISFVICFTASFAQSFQETPGFSQLLYKIRDPNTKANEFRKSLKQIGEYLALNAQQDLATSVATVKTVLGEEASHLLCAETPVLITILRAGLPLYLGVLKIFPTAESGFIAMSRNEETLIADVQYIALPEVKDKSVIIVDTMIATGGSILDAIKVIENHGPKQIIIIGALAAKYGMQKILAYNPSIKIYVGAVDPLLNENGYIVPGLGDAGDRAFGQKAIKK